MSIVPETLDAAELAWLAFWQKLRADLDEAIRDGRIRPTENYYTGNSGRALGPNDPRGNR